MYIKYFSHENIKEKWLLVFKLYELSKLTGDSDSSRLFIRSVMRTMWFSLAIKSSSVVVVE